jgi:hypothetical protein
MPSSVENVPSFSLYASNKRFVFKKKYNLIHNCGARVPCVALALLYIVGWVDIGTSTWVSLKCIHFYVKVPKTAKKSFFGQVTF